MTWDLGPVFREHAAGEWVDLAERYGLHPGAFKAQVEAADPSEQGQDLHSSATFPASRTVPTSSANWIVAAQCGAATSSECLAHSSHSGASGDGWSEQRRHTITRPPVP